jgi:hypothetical protein
LPDDGQSIRKTDTDDYGGQGAIPQTSKATKAKGPTMNPETLAIARENLIALGNTNPTPDQVAKEAQRIYEANKSTIRPHR